MTLGKNPIILNAGLMVYYHLIEKLTPLEKLKLKELDQLENIENQIKSSSLGSDIKDEI